MARPRSKSSKTTRTDEFRNLSSEVLRLRHQNLNLPITGSRARLLERLRLETNSAPAATQLRSRGRPQNGRVHKNTSSASNVRVRPRPRPGCSLMCQQTRLTRRPTVPSKTGNRTSTQPSKNYWRTWSHKSYQMQYFRPLRCRPSRKPCRPP